MCNLLRATFLPVVLNVDYFHTAGLLHMDCIDLTTKCLVFVGSKSEKATVEIIRVIYSLKNKS